MSPSLIRVRSEIAADIAGDIAELRRLKQLQARIFGELRSDEQRREFEQRRELEQQRESGQRRELEQQRESEQQRQDYESLARLARLLVELVQKLGAERDALAAQLADQNRIAELRRMADEIMAFAADRREDEAPVKAEATPPRPIVSSSPLSPPPRRSLNAGGRPPARPSSHYSARNERATWALRS